MSGASASRADRPLAMVTGGARRVGLASAKALARAGCDLVITFNRSADAAREAEAELTALGANVRLIGIDLDDSGATDLLARRLAAELGRLDVLVHNASTYAPSPVGDLSVDDALRHYRVNALAPLVLTARLAPLLERSSRPGGGAVVAMLDIHALGRPRRGYAAYSMSKAALGELVRTLARDLAPRVRVNAVAPGAVAFAERGPDADPDMQRAYISRVPLGRSGTPEEAAEVVRWLALEASYVTGETVRVDGGRWLT